MAAKYLSAEEVLRRALNGNSDGDYSDEREAEISEEDKKNGRSELQEGQESETNDMLSDKESCEEPDSVFFYTEFQISYVIYMCLQVFANRELCSVREN